MRQFKFTFISLLMVAGLIFLTVIPVLNAENTIPPTPQNTLDLKDLQIIDLKLESLAFQAALAQSQYTQFQSRAETLTHDREKLVASLAARNNVDSSKFTINSSGVIEEKK